MAEEYSFPGMPFYIEKFASRRKVDLDPGVAGAQHYARLISSALGQLGQHSIEDRETVVAEARKNMARYFAAGEGIEAAIDEAEEKYVTQPRAEQREQQRTDEAVSGVGDSSVLQSRGLQGPGSDSQDASGGTDPNSTEPRPVNTREPEGDDPVIPNSGIDPNAQGRVPGGPTTEGSVARSEATPADASSKEAKEVIRPGEGDKPFAYDGPRGSAASETVGTVEPGSAADIADNSDAVPGKPEVRDVPGASTPARSATNPRDQGIGASNPGVSSASKPESGKPKPGRPGKDR